MILSLLVVFVIRILRKVLNEERAGISERGSLLHKFPYNIDLIEPNDIKTIDYTDFNILETQEKMRRS